MTSDIQCLCCKKSVKLISHEPEFYCGKCVRKGEIHNSVDDISPVKWYHTIKQESFQIQNIIDIHVKQIKNIILTDKSWRVQILVERVNATRALVEKLRSKRDNKIKIRESFANKRKVNFTSRCDLSKDLEEANKKLSTLSAKTLQIQIYLNRIQCIFIEELFRLIPIKQLYTDGTVCDLPLSISFVPSLLLETDDSTASAMLLLVVLVTSIAFILDLHQSSMDVRRYAVEALCRLETPLSRDELMSVYGLLVRVVHHVVRATIYRDGRPEQQGVSVSTLRRPASAANNPLTQLAMLAASLKEAVVMESSLSQPYTLLLDRMFANPLLEVYNLCPPNDRLDSLGFLHFSGADVPCEPVVGSGLFRWPF